MAAATPVATVAALVRAIEKSGLLGGDKLARVRELGDRAGEPKHLARELVKEGLLTRWQAEQLLNGFYRLMLGKYKLLDQLASTPTGRLYLAEHAQMGRRHTLKVLAKRLAANQAVVTQFLESAKRACSLDHRNIGHIYDVNHDPERKNHYIVMEHVEGQTLEELVERDGPLELLAALDFIGQAAEGLAHAHRHGVVHGDIKPANLLRDQAGTVKILDMSQSGFGAAPETDNPDESIEMAALAAVIFQAPELRGEDRQPNAACDVFSLGSVLCYLLTAKAAPDAAKAESLLKERAELTPEVIGFCTCLMADPPAERPASMEAVIERLNALVRTIVAVPAPPPSATPPPPPRSPDESVAKPTPAGEPVARPKPPVAKRLEGEAVPPILLPDEPQPAANPEPIASVVIKTKGRVGRKPGAKPAVKKDAALTADGEAAERPTSASGYGPLLVAGAIGGGGVLALSLLAAILYFVTVGRNSSSPAAPTAAAPKGAAAAPQPTEESNPVPVSPEVNPQPTPAAAEETNPSPPAGADPTMQLAALPQSASRPTEPPSAPSGPALSAPRTLEAEPAIAAAASTSEAAAPTTAAKVDAPAQGDSSAKAAAPKPGPQKSSDETPAETAPSKPAPSKPAPSKSAPDQAAKPAPAKPAPSKAARPAAKAPFDGFAVAVDLPALVDESGKSVDRLPAPAPLGPCRVDATAQISIVLHGGESALRTSRQKFELAPTAGQARQWEIVLGGAPPGGTIATLAAQDDQLLFAWTDEGLRQAAAARQLCNCALELTAGKSRHVVALRLPFHGDALAVDLEKPSASIRWAIGDLLPATKHTFVEVTRVEGLETIKKEPQEAVNPGTPIVVSSGPDDKSQPLVLKVSPTLSGRNMTVSLLPQIRVEGVLPLRVIRRKELAAELEQAALNLPKAQTYLSSVKQKRASSDPVKTALIEAEKASAAKTVSQLSATVDQLGFVLRLMEQSPGETKMHFRVYHQAGPVQVDVLVTEEASGGAGSKK